MENKISQVALVAEIPFNEVFLLQYYNHGEPWKHCKHILTENGLFTVDYKNQIIGKSSALEGILLGKHKVIHQNVV